MNGPRLTRILLMAGAIAIVLPSPTKAAEVITLTQTGCQFVEPEGVDHDFAPHSADDCEEINARTGAERLAEAEVLHLEPGTYVFRVSNENVPYELGFWLRDKDYNPSNPVHRLTKTSVSGGGLSIGETRDYTVELTAGEYVYSCPLNPTPNYRLVVR